MCCILVNLNAWFYTNFLYMFIYIYLFISKKVYHSMMHDVLCANFDLQEMQAYEHTDMWPAL